MEEFALQLGWRKKAPRRMTDALYEVAASLPVVSRAAAANAATTTLVEEAFGEATPPQPDNPDQAISVLAFVCANLFPGPGAQQEAVDQLLRSAAALAARVSVSQGRMSQTPPRQQPPQPPQRAPSPQPTPPQGQTTTAASTTNAATTRITRRRCEGCGRTTDSCVCQLRGGGARGSSAPLARQPPQPNPKENREPEDNSDSNSTSTTSNAPSARTTDTDARTSRSTSSRPNRRPGTFKDPAVLWDPAAWEAELSEGGAPRDLERELLRAAGAQSLAHDSFPRELAEALAQICAEWAERPGSQLIPEMALELLFRQKLWTTPGADKPAVDQAMRRVRAQALPDKFRKAAATLEAKARKTAEATQRTAPRPQRQSAPAQGQPQATRQASGGARARIPKALWDTLSPEQRATATKR